MARILILSLVFTGGAAALSWEILWQHNITLAFGSSALGAAITLACFAFGMGVGTVVAKRYLLQWTARNSALVIYAILELIIGANGALLPWAFQALAKLDTTVYSTTPSLAPFLQFICVLIALLPASAAMGASVPLFTVLARRINFSLSVMYAVNTVGAAAGVGFATFVAIPALGIAHFGCAVSLLNLVVGGTCLAISFAYPNNVPATTNRVDATSSADSVVWPLQLGIAFVTGYAVFALEVAWFRALRSALMSTTETFAIILAAALVAISLGGALSSRTKEFPISLLFGSGILIFLTTPVIERFDSYIVGNIGEITIFQRFLLCIILICPAFLAMSVQTPWLMNRHSDPRRVSLLYLSNTVGAFIGAVSAGWLLLPKIGLAHSCWFIGLIICIFSISVLSKIARSLAGVFLLVSALFAFLFDAKLGEKRLIGLTYYGGNPEILRHFDGPDVTSSVVKYPDGTMALFIDGFMMAVDHRVSLFMKWMAFAPSLMLDTPPRKALVICFGTGQTINATRKTGVMRADIVDINPKVFDFAAEFGVNEHVTDDPIVNKIVMDGRAWLRRTNDVYDFITLEPPAPNFAGVNNLYSREFYQLAKARLSSQGIMSQWLPSHMVSSFHSRAIVKTFQSVFPDTEVYIDPQNGFGFVIGSKAGNKRFSPEVLQARKGEQSYIPWEELPLLNYYAKADLVNYTANIPNITDDNQLLAYGELLDSFQTGLRPLSEVIGELDSSQVQSQTPISR